MRRDSCPVLSEPYLILATYRRHLPSADDQSSYLRRVKLLAGSDPELWYLCGVEELLANDSTRAWASWRRSLELSDRFRSPILAVGSRLLTPARMVDLLLPDKPGLLVAAAFELYPEANAADRRRPFIQRALHLLENQQDDVKADDLHVKAVVLRELRQPAKALAVYEQLLGRDPGHAEWRYENARLLYEQGRLDDARRELNILLAQHSKHAAGRELLAIVLAELIRKKQR